MRTIKMIWKQHQLNIMLFVWIVFETELNKPIQNNESDIPMLYLGEKLFSTNWFRMNSTYQHFISEG